VAKLLVLRGAIIDTFDDEQQTPLGQAARHGNLEIARLLIDHGANLHTTDSNGWTPLHLASKQGHLDVVTLLLRRGGDVDGLDKINKTATELALENDNGEIASFLVEYKTRLDVRNKVRSATLDTAQYGTDEYGKDEARASLHDASKDGKLDVVKSLLDQGADVNATDADGATPLHLAAIEGNQNRRVLASGTGRGGGFT
jgi:ankyrin repeat protein